MSSIGNSLYSLEALVPLIATSSNASQTTQENASLTRQACEDILCRQADSTNLVDALRKHTDKTELRLIPVGPSSNTQALAMGLTKQGLNVSIFETSYESMLRSNLPGTAASGQIAIIGMSGRFPGAQSTDEYCK